MHLTHQWPGLGRYDVTTIGSPRVMTIVCSKCADGDPSAVLMVHPSSAVNHPSRPAGDNRLYGNDKSRPEKLPVPWGVVVGDERLFVDRPAYAGYAILSESRWYNAEAGL